MQHFIHTIKSELSWLDTSNKQLRKFGTLVVAVLVLILGFIFFTKGHEFNTMLFVASGAVLLFTIFLPRIFLFPYYLWMTTAFVLGFFVGDIILAALFFLVVSPLAVIRRMFRDKKTGTKNSNWTPVVGTPASQKMDRLF